MKRLRYCITFVLLVLVSFPFALLPYRLSLKIGDGLGLLIFFFWRSRRRTAIENLRSAIERGALVTDEDPRALICRNFKNLGRLLVEVNKIYYGFGKPVFRSVEVRGEDNYRRAQKKGRGVICITGHCGNWELMAIYLSMRVAPTRVVARRQANTYINRFLEKTREKYGNSVIYKEGALKKILGALRKGENVGILMDQSAIRSEGIIIHFLGKNAYAMKTPAVIARKTGAPVIPLFIRRTGTGHLIEIGKEIPLAVSSDNEAALLQDTVSFSRPIEEFIRKYPAEWLWIHRRWKRIKEQY